MRSLLLAALLLAAVPAADACSTFALHAGEAKLFGQNYDWHVGDGLATVNRRGVKKYSPLPDGSMGASWTSKFGSVTFNQYGMEMPNGGMNEAGLVVAIMWLEETKFPDADVRPGIQVLQWIQRQLDLCERVDDIVASDSSVRIQSDVPVHFLAADRFGGVATIEFLGGKMVVHAGEKLAAPVLTNSTFESSARFLGDCRAGKAAADGPGSLQRFARAAEKVGSFSGEKAAPTEADVFATLDSIAQGTFTKWSICYDQANRRIAFRTLANAKVRRIDFKSLDFSCDAPAKIADMNAPGEGDLAPALSPATIDRNFATLKASVAGTPFLASMKPEQVKAMAGLPFAFTCAND